MVRQVLLLTHILAIVSVLTVTGQAHGGGVAEEARTLLRTYHEDLTRIDRARDALEAAVRSNPQIQIETAVLLSRAWFLWADIRARTADEKLAAYDRGRQAGKQAIDLAPNSPEAHFWYAANTARWGRAKGIVRSLFLLTTLRKELETIFRLNPSSALAHSLAGNILSEVPTLFGGDKSKAEEHFKKGLQIDPRFTGLRVDLSRLYIAAGRYVEARRELQRVLEETHPIFRATWVVKDVPLARRLLRSIADRKMADSPAEGVAEGP